MREEVFGDARLVLGDCVDVLASVEDGSVDMIWTDPPYGSLNHDGDFNSKLHDHRGLKNDPIFNDSQDEMRSVVNGMLTHATRILKKKSSCCCCVGGGGPIPTFSWLCDRVNSDGLLFFHSVIWDKLNPGLGLRYRRQYEMVMVSHPRGGTIGWSEDGSAVPNIVSISKPRDQNHPNEKPVGLPAWFIQNHTDEGDFIIDPFMGSGTTGVACLQMNRKFLGVEIDINHFDTACRRLDAALKTVGNLLVGRRRTKREFPINLLKDV